MTGTQEAVAEYRAMWLYVLFDLPGQTKGQRRQSSRFRRRLLKDGFSMHQFSVYTRLCSSPASADAHIERIRNIIPDEGAVSILKMTEKQYASDIHILNQKKRPHAGHPEQLVFL